jgi:N-ethylmaleimide reductase
LDRLGIGYLHVLEAISGQMAVQGVERVAPHVRSVFNGALILNGGYDKASASEAIETGAADLVAFGVPYIANPDLVERFHAGASLNQPDFATFYMGEEKGYIDYPALTA